jgi:hypothetical protein
MIYLYVKTHKVTGLRYLGKTTKSDYHAYPGSGKAWLQHLKEHGKEYETLLLRECLSQKDLHYWGRYYSNLWRVTSAMDDYGNLIYANMIPETGGGALYGELNPSKRPEVKESKKQKMSGRKRPELTMVVSKSWTSERKGNHRFSTSGQNHYTHRDGKLGNKHPLFGSKRPGTGLSGDANPAKRPEVREKMRGPRGNNLAISGDNHYTKQPGYASKISGNNHYTKKENFSIKKTNKNYDHNLYVWINLETGDIVQMTRRDFIDKYKLRASDVCQVIKGERSKTKSWKLLGIVS